METRRLGKTGHPSSVVAFGSYAIGDATQDEADRVIEDVLARDVNHIDVAPSYAEAELRLGDYLKRHPRPDVFVGAKTQKRDKAGAREELLRTLDRLGRDRHDLYQIHAVVTADDLAACLAPGGPLEAILEAREEGLVAHIGITGHGWQSPATHLAALDAFPFATVMTSCNRFLHAHDAFRRDWERLVARCRADDVGIHVLKATAKGPWGDRTPTHHTWYEPFTDQRDVDRAVAWALRQDVTTLCSAGDVRLFPVICDAAERYKDVGAQEQAALLTEPGYADFFVEA